MVLLWDAFAMFCLKVTVSLTTAPYFTGKLCEKQSYS